MIEHLAMSSPDNYYLQGVLPSAINTVWESVQPFVIKALDYADNKFNDEDVYNALMKSEMQLWIVFHEKGHIAAICITEVKIYPREKAATILFVSGEDVLQWIHFNEVIQAWAKSVGCDSLYIYGRAGWKKLLMPYGYEQIYTVLKVKLPSFH